MQAFRIRSSSSVQPTYPHFLAGNHSSSPNFPFHNNKLQSKRKQKESIQIKQLKSRAQVSRKRLDSIPLLKNLRLDQCKVSIMKSAKDSYNLYLRNSAKQSNYDEKVMVVNGQNRGHRRTFSDQSKRRHYPSAMDWHKQGGSWAFRTGSQPFVSSEMLTLPSHPKTLYISGQPKSISPSRQSMRSSSQRYFSRQAK